MIYLSFLNSFFSGRHGTLQDREGRFFIDRDGEAFNVILNFLRTNRVHYGAVDKALVHSEAEFYRIPLPIDASSMWLDVTIFLLFFPLLCFLLLFLPFPFSFFPPFFTFLFTILQLHFLFLFPFLFTLLKLHFLIFL